MSEAIRVRSVARNAADRARTAAINELKALITAPDDLRATLRGLTRRVGRVVVDEGDFDVDRGFADGFECSLRADDSC